MKRRMKRWLKPYYDRVVTDLASRIAAKLLGAVEGAARPKGDSDPIRSQTWYPVLAQAVFVAGSSRKSGHDKREVVVDTMTKWFTQRNLQCPAKRTLHLAIELALTDPVTRG